MNPRAQDILSASYLRDVRKASVHGLLSANSSTRLEVNVQTPLRCRDDVMHVDVEEVSTLCSTYWTRSNNDYSGRSVFSSWRDDFGATQCGEHTGKVVRLHCDSLLVVRSKFGG